MTIPVDEWPDIPYDHCLDCGDPIFRPKRKRCNFCAAAKYDVAGDLASWEL